MTSTEKRIVANYSGLFAGLSSASKLELIRELSKSLMSEKKSADDLFYTSFGAFASERSPEEMIKEIKEGRKFKRKEIKL